MPAPNSFLPRYFGCSTSPPRSTAMSDLASRMATSTAVSMASSVASSSALRKRSFFEVTIAALPRRSSKTLPKSMRPSATNFCKYSAVSLRGNNIAWHRCRPAVSLASTWARKMPWSISTPSFSPCKSSASAATCAAVGVRPGTAMGSAEAGRRDGGGEDQVFQADESRALVRQLVVKRLGMGGEEMLALFARGGEDGLCRARLAKTSRRLLRQAAEQIGAELPVPRVARPIDKIIAGALRRGRDPFGERALIEGGGAEFGRRLWGIGNYPPNPFTIPLGISVFRPPVDDAFCFALR